MAQYMILPSYFNYPYQFFIEEFNKYREQIAFLCPDTWIFPLVQMGQLGVYQDAYVTERLLSEAPAGSQLYISTGYFNLTHKYMKTILYESHADCRLLMAHPDVS